MIQPTSTEPMYHIRSDELEEALRLFRLYNICPVTINELERLVKSRGVHPIYKPKVKFCSEMMVDCGYWNGTQCTHGDYEHPDCVEWLNKHDAALIAQAREDVLPLLERLAEAFHTYEMDVADYDFPAPPKHRKLMDDLQKKIESLRPEVKK